MLAHVVLENTAQRGTGIENGSEWSNGTVDFDRTGPTEKKWSTSRGGPIFSKLFRLDRTVPFSFRPKFPEILVEWKAPPVIRFTAPSQSASMACYYACLKWLLPELSFSDRWSRGAKL